MYYYAYLDESDICTQIYAMPAQITGDQFISIADNALSTRTDVVLRAIYEF